MNKFILYLNFMFNFFNGAFIPIIPLMNVEGAGLAFSVYGVGKIISYHLFGAIIDKGDIKKVFYLTLVLCLSAALSYFLFENLPLIAKIFEGLAFASGTVFCFSYLSKNSPSKKYYENELKKVIMFTSLGAFLGPMFGYIFISYDFKYAAYVFVLVSLFTLVFALKYKSTSFTSTQIDDLEDGKSKELNKWLVISILLLKGFLIGFQPIIGYWCTEILNYSNTLSSLAYACSGLAFIAGSLRPSFSKFYLPLIAVVVLELSLEFKSPFVYVGVGLLSFWLGQTMVKCMIELGWVTSDKSGKLNSTWLMLSDIPLAITPFVFWEFKELNDIVFRQLVSLSMIGFVLYSFIHYKKECKI